MAVCAAAFCGGGPGQTNVEKKNQCDVTIKRSHSIDAATTTTTTINKWHVNPFLIFRRVETRHIALSHLVELIWSLFYCSNGIYRHTPPTIFKLIAHTLRTLKFNDLFTCVCVWQKKNTYVWKNAHKRSSSSSSSNKVWTVVGFQPYVGFCVFDCVVCVKLIATHTHS